MRERERLTDQWGSHAFIVRDKKHHADFCYNSVKAKVKIHSFKWQITPSKFYVQCAIKFVLCFGMKISGGSPFKGMEEKR